MIKPFVGMIVAMIPIPGINIVGLQIAISAALGAGLQAAINGGSMEQVFIAAALGFTAGYAGSIIGADKLAHAMSGQPLFATGSAPGVLSYRVPEGGGWSLARMWPAIAANFGTKMAEGIVEGDGSDPTYKPAPPELIETRDYYIWRNANAPTRIRGNNYYTNYGLRKFDEFQRLRESASPELREFIDRASVELQLSLEDALRSNPRLELSRKRLAQAAFDMHSDAYVAAGFKSLSIGDKARVGWTGGKDIFGEGIGVGICEIWQTIR